MKETQSVPGTDRAAGLAANGRDGIPHRPVDRSHLLRRPMTRSPFPANHENGRVRIRRERRVFETFSAIHSLARNGRDS